MLTIRQLQNARVYGAPKKRSGERPKVGRVADVVFAPDGLRVVGFVIERSDIALMISRRDLMLALDRATITDRGIEVDGDAAWGNAAGKRLNVDWDKSVVWRGMPVHTESKIQLGLVRDAVFDSATGELNALGLTTGATADLAVGVRDLPARMVRGFDGEGVIVSDEAAAIDVDGGAAASAGRATAVAMDTAGRATAVAAAHVGKAAAAAAPTVDKAARAAGEVAGKAASYTKSAARVAAKSDAGKKTMGWLNALKNEVVDAMGDPDSDDEDPKR